jgi:glucokinase
MRILGIDLGGMFVKHAVLDLDSEPRVLEQGQTETLLAAGPDAVLARVAEAARAVGDVDAVGLAMPGPLDLEAGRARDLPNFPRWEGIPVIERLEAALGRRVALIRDGCAFALAEHALGAGRGCRDMVGVTVGTGIGGGLVLGGALYLGADGSAGELGHQTVDPDGPACGCGNRGCLEALASGPAIAAAAGSGSAEEACATALAGDERARIAFAEAGRWLGLGLANVAAIVVPERIVIGGGVAAAGELLLRPARQELTRRLTILPASRVELVPAQLGSFAGAIGAGLWAGAPSAYGTART